MKEMKKFKLRFFPKNLAPLALAPLVYAKNQEMPKIEFREKSEQTYTLSQLRRGLHTCLADK